MKTLTYEQKISKIAKVLVKEWKANKSTSIAIKDSFTYVCSANENGYHFNEGTDKSIYIGDYDEEGFARLTRDIAKAVEGLLKLPKKMLVFKDERECSKWCGWSSWHYTLVRKFVIVTPCKQFGIINKKLVKLGLKTIPFNEWFHGEVAGKREQIFSTAHNYYCTDERKCEEVLSFLKGKKKMAKVEIIRDEDFADRDYGIEHETEWYGHLYYRLKFTDAKNHTITL